MRVLFCIVGTPDTRFIRVSALFLSRFLAVLFAFSSYSATVSANGEVQVPEVVPKGFARLYIFRPGFSDVGRDESPLVGVNTTELFELAYKSYASLVLKPGSYVVSTKPNVGDPGIWNGSFNVSLDADRAYFLAVWNDTAIGVGSLSAITPALGLLGVAMDHTQYSTAVRFELVPENDAAPFLKEMTRITVNVERLGLKP